MVSKHDAAYETIRRAVLGLEGSADELQGALDHVARCSECSAALEVDCLAALVVCGEDDSTMPDVPVDPVSLFDRALTTALSDSDPIVRKRAAERLGNMPTPGAPALAALVAAAAEDPDEGVRSAALRALDLLDAAVSLPQRIVDAWAADPSLAAGYLETVLERLAAASSGIQGITSLDAVSMTKSIASDAVTLASTEGVTGTVSVEGDEIRLRVDGLPSIFEDTKPVVAVIKALKDYQQPIVWAGPAPGLIEAEKPVKEGRLDVVLGRRPSQTEWVAYDIADRVYLLRCQKAVK